MVNLTYIKKRRRRRAAAIVSGVCSVIISIFIIIAFCLIYVDRFTVKTSETSLYLKEEQFNKPGTYLEVRYQGLKFTDTITDTQYTDIPTDIEDGDGFKSTYHYFAYSFYLGLRDGSKQEECSYTLRFNKHKVPQETSEEHKRASLKLEEALKILLIKNGEKHFYAKHGEKQIIDEETGESITVHYNEPLYYGDQQTEKKQGVGVASEQITPFDKGEHIIATSDTILPGNEYKYTVVMWIDGWESTDEMRGGAFGVDLEFIAKT